jgi:ferredoxin-NADP reductase
MTTQVSSANLTSMSEHAVFPAVLLAKEYAADDSLLLTFQREDGTELPEWSPGSHIDVVLPNGIVRQYSLCGNPADRRSYTVGVLHAPRSRGGSRFIHESLNIGDLITLQGPRNHFSLTDAEGYLFIAGGIGITPIMAMIREVQSQGKPWTLVYGGRTISSMAFRKELASFGNQVRFWPQDEMGIIDLPGVLGMPDGSTVVYACGPEPLLAAIENICSDSWPTGSLHLERFAAVAVDTTQDKSFEIELSQSGLQLTVPADRSVLSVLNEAGIPILSSCEEGTCGTCETTVLEGEVDHRDSVLEATEKAENSCMMVCVSRASCPRLVLDL